MSDDRKFELEYLVKSTPSVLFNFFCTPDGLAIWFADNVNIKDDLYSFVWDGAEQDALLIKRIDGDLLRFRWDDEDEDYFEFRFELDDLTSSTSLFVTDFADEDEKDEAKRLWDTQLNKLFSAIGL
ncbi:MAG: SRPBCC domain-containing protein [Flavobacteriales bacterium]|nr:SRPBCC domain-containing protein [Flavobacteriales bacterium]